MFLFPRKKFLALTLSLTLALSVAFCYPPGRAEADTIDDAVGELQKVYNWLDKDPAGKDDVVAAKAEAKGLPTNPSQDPWPDVFTELPTTEFEGSFGGQNQAKQAIVDLLRDATVLSYSTDAGAIKGELESFKSNHQATVTKILGSDFTVDELYGFLLAAKDKIPGSIIEDIPGLVAIASGDYAGIKESLKKWLKSSLESAATGSYEKFGTKLSDIGWSIDQLVNAYYDLQPAVDPQSKAEIALLKAYVRSETNFIKDGSLLPPDQAIALYTGDSLALKLSILGYPWAGSVLNWTAESNILTADNINKKITANATGSALLIAYNKNPDTDWVYKGIVVVSTKPSGGGGGAPAPAPGIGSEGGKVTGADGEAVVEIPAGALDKKVIITIKQIAPADVTAPPATLKLAGDIYEFGPAGTKLAKPVTITLQYDPAKLAGAKEETLAVYCLDETAKAWVSLGGTVDKIKHTVTVTVDHFSKYAVMVETVAKPPVVKFKDVDSAHWAWKNIEALVAREILKGYPDQTFRPENEITRAEFTTIVVRALGLTEIRPAAPAFADVGPQNWFYSSVEAAAKAGLVRGYENGTFRPENRISRQEMAVILVRALGKEDEAQAKATEKLAFADADKIAVWAKGCVVIAVAGELVKGYPDNTFGPLKNTTRAETAAMVYRFLEKIMFSHR